MAAHSYTNLVRYSNEEDLDKYIKNIQQNRMDLNFIFHEKQTQNARIKEYMLLGLRKLDGISIQEFSQKFIGNPIYIFKEELKKLIQKDLIEINGDRICLTKKGLDFANIVWEEFV